MSKEVAIYLNGKQLFSTTDTPVKPGYKIIKDYGDFVEADNGMLYWDSEDDVSGGQVQKDTSIGTMTLGENKSIFTVYRSPNFNNVGYIYIDKEIYILSRSTYDSHTVCN